MRLMRRVRQVVQDFHDVRMCADMSIGDLWKFMGNDPSLVNMVYRQYEKECARLPRWLYWLAVRTAVKHGKGRR